MLLEIDWKLITVGGMGSLLICHSYHRLEMLEKMVEKDIILVESQYFEECRCISYQALTQSRPEVRESLNRFCNGRKV